MRIVRWEPFRELDAMQGEMRRLLGQLGGAGEGRREPESETWLPPVDVSETESDLVLAFDVPGVSQDRIDVELDDNTLTVSGTRERASVQEGERFYRAERRFGQFSRSIPLPPGIAEEEIRADLRDGVLEIRVPKPRQAQPRRIQVGGGQQQAGGQEQQGTVNPTAGEAPS